MKESQIEMIPHEKQRRKKIGKNGQNLNYLQENIASSNMNVIRGSCEKVRQKKYLKR